MYPHDTIPSRTLPADVGEAAWEDVLKAVDRTYAELVDYQEQLETRNADLRILRQFLESIMGSVSDYLIVADRDGCLMEVSASFRDAVGFGDGTAGGRSLLDVVAPGSRRALSEAIGQVLAERGETTIEAELETATGTEPVEFRVAARLDRRRRATGVVLTGRPLGELRRAYSELAASHEDLKQAQTLLVRNEKLASLGRLLAGVAHELNNPISFVYANTHALEKYVNRFESYFERVQAGASREELVELRRRLRLDRDLKNMRSALEGARDGAERVRDIVDDLRRLSAEGSGEMAVFDLAETARVAVNWVERGSKPGLTVKVESDGPCHAIGRTGHIQQVLMNLVQNAVDAVEGRDAPRVTLRTREEGDRVVLDICDNGPGVPPDLAQAIFDPFFTTKSVGAGTGLGLSISHKIAEEHGGRLELIEHDGPGACFRLTLRRGAHP